MELASCMNAGITNMSDTELENNGSNGSNGAMIKAHVTRAHLAAPLSLDPYEDASPGPESAQGQRVRAISLAGILRYKWTIFSVGLVVLIISQAAVWSLIAPLYRAVVVIEVQPIIQKPLDADEQGSPVPFYSAYLSTQPDFITGTAVLNRVLDLSYVRDTNWYRNVPATPLDRLRSHGSPIDRLRDELEVGVPANKQILQVTMACAFPGEAKKIVEAVADEYIKYVTETKFESDRESVQKAREFKEQAENEILRLKTDLLALQAGRDIQTSDPLKLVDQNRMNIEKLKANASDLRLQIELIEQRLTRLSQPSTEEPTPSPNDAVEFARDERWRALRAQLDADQRALANLKLTLGDSHREVKRAESRFNQSKENLSDREAELRNSLTPVMVATPQFGDPTIPQSAVAMMTLSNDPAVLEQQRLDLTSRLQKYEERISTESAKLDRLWKTYEQFAEIQTQLQKHQNTVARSDRAIFEREQLRFAPAHIRRSGEAMEPGTPTEDKRVKMALAGVFAAIAAGLGAATLRHLLNPKVFDLRDVAIHGGASHVLGHVPLMADSESVSTNETLAGYQRESIRTIRTALIPMLTAGRGQAIQITSAGPGSGKTTFSILLAESLASAGKRVLLVDADLRRASLSRRENREDCAGLADLLRNPELPHSAVCISRQSCIDMIPAGGEKDVQTSDLLANGMLSRRLAEWRKTYDVVLVDSSPIIPIADGSMLAQQVDGSIVLVREGHCDRRVVGEAIDQIGAVGGRSLGIVFVSSRRRQPYHYYESYQPTGVHKQVRQVDRMPGKVHS